MKRQLILLGLLTLVMPAVARAQAALPPIKPLYDSGKLAVVHAVGQPTGTRSHFKDSEEIERAAPGTSLRTGWLDRVLGVRGAGTAFQAVQLGSNMLPGSLLGALDGAIAAIERNMGAAWSETVVALVTEFGRTAKINGTNGTDHGTGTVALLSGGALKGGRVIADWPGLKVADLHEARDLKATTDLRAVLKGLLRNHLRVDERALAEEVFPGSEGIKPLPGLLA